jgi:hypothetical protein
LSKNKASKLTVFQKIAKNSTNSKNSCDTVLLVGEPVVVDEGFADAGQEAGGGRVDGVDQDEGEDAVPDAKLSQDVNLRFF